MARTQFPVPTSSIFLLSLLLLSCSSGQGPEDAIQEDMGGVVVTLLRTPGFGGHQDFMMVDEETIIICGSSGTIIRSTDAGSSWGPVFQDSTVLLNALSRTCDGKIYAVGYSIARGEIRSGVIVRSSDVGESWERVDSTAGITELRDVDCLPNGPVIAAGYNSIFRSDDQGDTWNASSRSDLGGTYHSVDLMDHDHGFLTLGTGGLMVTGDGETWSHKPIAPGEIAIHYLAPVTGELLYGAPHPGITRSTDGGDTWRVLNGSPQNVRALSFADSLNGVALGVGDWSGGDFGYHYGSFFRTTDGGRTWKGTSRVDDVLEFVAVLWPELTRNRVYGLTRGELVRFDFDE